jgi:hypothetical protein
MGGDIGSATTRRTRMSTTAREAQNAMWIMVSDMGNGQLYILGSRMYLLYMITEKLNVIHTVTYA